MYNSFILVLYFASSYFMNPFLYTFLFIFWTLFGSFASVIIHRLKNGEGWICAGRSHCKTCERDLSALELVPIFSWLFQWWKCKWCKQKISAIYPILEISTGILFSFVWLFILSPELIINGNIFEWWRMIFFCSLMFFTIIYVFYDILFLEIPESVLLISNLWVFWALLMQTLWYPIFPYLPLGWFSFLDVIICFWVLAGLYYIFLAELKEIYDCAIMTLLLLLFWGYVYYEGFSHSALLSGTLAALIIYLSFFLQIILSWGRAMGWGDLRIAILMGLVCWASLAFPAWMICYIIWSIIGVSILIHSKIKDSKNSWLSHQIPFGPFIASWYLAVLFFFPHIAMVFTIKSKAQFIYKTTYFRYNIISLTNTNIQTWPKNE